MWIEIIRHAAGTILFLSMLVAACIGIARICGIPTLTKDLPWKTVFFGTVLLLLAGLTLMTEAHVAFQWTGPEKWVWCVVFVSLCLGLAGFLPGNSRQAVFTAGCLSIAFAAWIGIPWSRASSSTWETELHHITAWSAIAPAVLGVVLIWRAARRTAPAASPLESSSSGRRTQTAGIITLFGLLAAGWMAWRIITSREGAPSGLMPVWAPVVTATVLAITLGLRAAFKRSLWPDIALRFVAVVSIAVALAAGFDALRCSRPDIWSDFMNLSLEWTFGFIPASVFAGICALCVIAFGRLALRGRPACIGTVSMRIFTAALVVAAASHTLAACYGTSELMRCIICIDRETGRIRWSWEGLRMTRECMHPENSPASPSPLYHDGRVYAYFGRGGLVCCDADGRHLWTRSDLPHDSVYGAVSSPVLCEGDVILASENRPGGIPDKGYLVRINGKTGEFAWKRSRNVILDGRNPNARTPLIIESEGRRLVLIWEWNQVFLYDATTGEEAGAYHVQGLTCTDPVASAVSDGKRVYLAAKKESVALDLQRVQHGGEAIAWRTAVLGPGCSSPVLADGRLYLVTETGRAACLDTSTGAILWNQRLTGTYYPSLVSAGGNVYFNNTAGRTTIVRSDPDFKVIEENDIEDRIFASPAVADGRIFLRGEHDLKCIMAPGIRH